jgi:hypothetical protein
MGANQSALADTAGVPILYYLNIRGRGYICRLELRLAGQEYKEVEIPLSSSSWKDDLDGFPYAQLPR